MLAVPKHARLQIITIPTDDAAFLEMVGRLAQSNDVATPQAFEVRLRRMFPRAVVRARELSGEAPAWYVYRDGGWRASLAGFWWEAPDLPRIVWSLVLTLAATLVSLLQPIAIGVLIDSVLGGKPAEECARRLGAG